MQYRIKDKEVVFNIQSGKKKLTYPFCGAKNMHVHSIYQREIPDLPIQNKRVSLLVDTRKMFCANLDYLHKTFAERHPFAEPKAKKTDQLVRNIIHASAQLQFCMKIWFHNIKS